MPNRDVKRLEATIQAQAEEIKVLSLALTRLRRAADQYIRRRSDAQEFDLGCELAIRCLDAESVLKGEKIVERVEDLELEE